MRSRAPLLVALAGALAGCAPSEERPSDVILIVCDTLRADHLSCYGYERPTSPRLDAFAATATRYEHAYSTAPWTLPAHASLFTGLFPFEHGAITELVSDVRSTVRPLAPEATTLAELFRDAGYATAGFVANDVFLSERLGIAQGFDTWDIRRARADGLLRVALGWLDEREEDEPVFLFLNFMDTHRPYYSRHRPALLAEDPGLDSPELLDELFEPVHSGEAGPDDPRVRRLVDQYDTAIGNLDDGLGALFDQLAERGRLDDALVVVTSDHGEYFAEHALLQHSKDVYEEALRIPLIVRAPGQTEGASRAERFSLAELPARVTELAGLRATGDARFRTGLPVLAENYYSRTSDLEHPEFGPRFRRVRRALILDGHKLIESSDGRNELYALGADPAEAADLAGEDAGRTTQMARSLARLIEASSTALEAGAIEDWSREELERMRALGY